MRSIIKQLLAGGVATVAITGLAVAADLGRPLPPPVYDLDWTGFYLGVNGGYAWNWGNDAVVFGSTVGLRPNPSGGLFGGPLGYNWQWTPEWVFGVETDFDGAGIFGSALASDPFGATAEDRVDLLGTLRGRAGYALENILLYGTGGLAYGRTELGTSVTDKIGGLCGPAGFCANASSTQWMVGWAAGVGFDWAFLPRWSFRTEYLHYDLGSRHLDLTDPGLPNFVMSTSTNFRGDILRGAINFRFD